jgi:C1A family cysteine protease
MKKLISLAFIFVIALSFVAAQEKAVSVDAIQEILRATDASWTAGENDVTRMTADEQKQLLGLLPGVYDPASVPAPTVVSFEPVRGGYETPHTPVRNQGQCGSCYSFGACGTYEGWRLLGGVTTDLSEQYFMMKAKAIGPYGGCSGWYLDTSMNLLKNYGVANESDCAYKAYESACPSSATPVHKIGAWSSTTDKGTIQNAVHQYGPVYVGFAVYTDFSSYTSGYYEYKTGSLRGYHAVCVVGYDDVGFKVKNSWGTGWGDKGYFKIKYSQMTNSVQFGTCFGGSFYITR